MKCTTAMWHMPVAIDADIGMLELTDKGRFLGW